jgi:hypothetical protein
MNRISQILFISVTLILFNSCVKEDLSKISDDFDWMPSVSVPVWKFDFGVDDYGGSSKFISDYKRNGYILKSEYIEINFSKLFDNTEYVEELMYRFKIENNFPARVECSAYYYDGNRDPILREDGDIYPVFEDVTINVNSPNVDDEGNITKSFILVHDEYLDIEDKETFLKDVREILVLFYLYDLDTRPEALNRLDNYNIKASMGIRAALDVPVN